MTYRLIKSYLQGRYQRVVLNNYSPHSCSNWCKVKHSVPQGSILGPLLLILYINDLPQITNYNSKLVLFADDTSAIVTDPDPLNFEKDLSKITQDIHEWFETNLLSLNLYKTHYMQSVTKSSFLTNLDILRGNK